MISDLVFVLRNFVLALMVVLVFKIQVGERTLEEETIQWAHKSAITLPLREVAHGLVMGTRQVWMKLVGIFNQDLKKSLSFTDSPGARELGVQLERSKAYVKEKAQDLQKSGSSN